MTATAKHNPLRRHLAATLVLMLALGAVARGQSGSGGYFVPGDAKHGMKIFFSKGCGRCHSVLGEGGRSAPDLARAPGGNLSAAELLAGMWNHAPAMWEKMRVEGVNPPKFDSAEMADLFAFIYSVRSLDEPGDAERGRQLLSEKKCVECHAVAGKGGRVGPDLKKWAQYRNPVSWVQTMWNHAPAMQSAMAGRGLRWPELHDNDVPDLIAYIRKAAPPPGARVYLRPADPAAGRRTFQEKGCVSCHAIRGSGGKAAPDLGSRSLPRTLGQFAGLMWNHAPAMWMSMRAQAIPRPQLSDKEMADLIAYLFSERYFEVAGNPERGRQMFEEKGCSNCHRLGGGSGVGPDLGKWRGQASSIPLAAALWNHGPVMLQSMREQQVTWPRFKPGEIVDIMEFINRPAPPVKSRPATTGGR